MHGLIFFLLVGWRTTLFRMLSLLAIYALNTYRSERWKSNRKDNAIRSFLQLEYTMFATPWVAWFLFTVHVCLVLYDVQQLMTRDEQKDRDAVKPHKLRDVTVETHHVASSAPLSPGSPAIMSASAVASRQRLATHEEYVPLEDLSAADSAGASAVSAGTDDYNA